MDALSNSPEAAVLVPAVAPKGLVLGGLVVDGAPTVVAWGWLLKIFGPVG